MPARRPNMVGRLSSSLLAHGPCGTDVVAGSRLHRGGESMLRMASIGTEATGVKRRCHGHVQRIAEEMGRFVYRSYRWAFHNVWIIARWRRNEISPKVGIGGAWPKNECQSLRTAQNRLSRSAKAR